jgi:hypothetical protein
MFCVLTDHGYVPFVVITIRFFPHSWLITRSVTRVTQRMLYVEQELFTRPEYQRSPPVFRGVRVARSLVFFLRFCGLLFFLLAIVLSVFLRFTSSGYSFDISKCFLWWEGYKWLLVFISRRYAFSMSEHIDITYIVLENGHREEIVEIRKSVYLC